MKNQVQNKIKLLILLFLIFISACGDRIENPLNPVQKSNYSLIGVDVGDGLITKEDSLTDTFTIVLTKQPEADVTISPIVSSDTGEVTVSPGSVTFTTADWSIPQVITVTGVDDVVADGTQAVTISFGSTSSTDPNWNSLPIPGVTVYNLDDETLTSPGVLVSAGSSNLVTEGGASSSFEVVLKSQPTANVTINVTVSDTTEGTITTPFSGTSGTLTFTTANWSTPQTVTVQGLDDAITDGNQPFTVTLGTTASTDPAYNGTFNPPDVNFTNIDNDSAGITVNVGDGLITKEHPTSPLSDSFQVVLNSQPTADVTINVTVSDATEGTITAPFSGVTGTLTFTTANWNIPQTVIVQGTDDTLSDGMITYQITLAAASSTDSSYSGLDPDDVTVENLDNESLGSIVIVPETNYVTSESGTTAAFKVFLSAQPAANVTIGGNGNIRSLDATEGTITSPFAGSGTLVFTPTNWSVPQKIIVTGSADDGDGIDMPYQIDLGYATSTDSYWDGMYGGSIGFTNLNNYSTAFPAGYTWSVFTPGSDSFAPITGTNILFNNIPGSVFDSEDEGYAIVPIGFHFHYINNYYNNIVVYTNGLASFDFNIIETWNYTLFAAAASPFLVLAPWWDDMTFMGSSASVFYETSGTSPNRVFTVEWRNGEIVLDDERYTFQLKLYESTNVIEFIYGGTSGTGGATTTAVWGLKDNIGGAPNTYIEAYDGNTTLGPFSYADSLFPTNDYGVEGHTVRFTP